MSEKRVKKVIFVSDNLSAFYLAKMHEQNM